jgi:hypothetical protein
MADIKVVTGYIPIPGFHRADEYKALGEKLFEAIMPHEALVFDDEQQKWEDTWLAQQVRSIGNVTHSVADNPTKNTLAYHAVQHQKFAWLTIAAENDNGPADMYVWIDYGIFHLPDLTAKVVSDYLKRAQDYPIVTMPGCWPKRNEIPHDSPCWRFCGGLMAVPRTLVKPFTRFAMATALRQIMTTRNVEFEVNTLARVELGGQVPIQWYQADHNASMFTGAP